MVTASPSKFELGLKVRRYKCGECDYEETDMWVWHQSHYLAHRMLERYPEWRNENHRPGTLYLCGN